MRMRDTDAVENAKMRLLSALGFLRTMRCAARERCKPILSPPAQYIELAEVQTAYVGVLT